jgi:dihydrofolate synthase/folylpolyglutamate synthase
LFEFVTLAAFIHFRDKKVDIAVMETGLGGRLDATNVVEPQVVIITPISLDHQRHLGATVKEITNEKCGIVKRGIPTVTAVQPKEVMMEIRRWCDDVGSPLFVADPDKVTSALGLVGEHQRQNASCAVEAAQLLSDGGWQIEAVSKALSETKWAGRIETLREFPNVVIDGAHNLAGAESLALYVHSNFPRDNAVLMLGVLQGKDIAGMCRTLVPHFREVICVRAPSKRAASPKDIAATARSYGANVRVVDDVSEAFEESLGGLSVEDTLVVSGSLSTIGAVRNMFKKPD